MWVAVVEVHGVESMQVSSCTRPSCSSDLIREEQLHTRRSLKHSCREVPLAFSRCCIVQTLLFGTSVSSDKFKNHDAQALSLCLIMMLQIMISTAIMIVLIMSVIIML